MADDKMRDDRIQHGIDDSPEGDAEKGAALGGIGGAAVGEPPAPPWGRWGPSAERSWARVAGAAASGLAVAAVDRIDNDDTVSGMGDGVTPDVEDQFDDEADEDLLVEDEEVVVAHTGSRSPDMAAGSGMRPHGSGSPWPTVSPAEPANSSGMVGGSRSADWTPGQRRAGDSDGWPRCRRDAGHARDHREGVGHHDRRPSRRQDRQAGVAGQPGAVAGEPPAVRARVARAAWRRPGGAAEKGVPPRSRCAQPGSVSLRLWVLRPRPG